MKIGPRVMLITTRQQSPGQAPKTQRPSVAPLRFVDGFDPPKRTREQAVREASDFLRGPDGKQAFAPNGMKFPNVERDPATVNSVDDTMKGSVRYRTARTQVTANAGLEKASLNALPPKDRAQYSRIKAACSKDPVAQVAFQKLLFEGTLTGSKDTENTRLVDRLANLSTATLARGIDRQALVGNLVQELATPSSIDQGITGTCAPTTVAIQLAMTNPAEYARLIGGLASKNGRVELPGGTRLEREVGTIADDGSGRASTQRLLGPALMQLARSADKFDYDNRDPMMRLSMGTKPEALARVYQALRNSPMASMEILQFPGQSNPAAAQGIELIRQQLEQGLSVSIGYHPNGFGEAEGPERSRHQHDGEEGLVAHRADVQGDRDEHGAEQAKGSTDEHREQGDERSHVSSCWRGRRQWQTPCHRAPRGSACGAPAMDPPSGRSEAEAGVAAARVAAWAGSPQSAGRRHRWECTRSRAAPVPCRPTPERASPASPTSRRTRSATPAAT